MELADTTKSFFELNQEKNVKEVSIVPPEVEEVKRLREKSVDLNALDYEGNESDKEKVSIYFF